VNAIGCTSMKLRASLGTALCLFLAALACQPAQAGAKPVPVMIGGERDLDACSAVGVVSGLDPKPTSTLAVRSGPGLQFARIDRLASGTRVWLCDPQGDWVGIVYGRADQDCGVSTPSAQRRPYTGPCAAGWVFHKYISLLAG
jgi:hypothetical protein